MTPHKRAARARELVAAPYPWTFERADELRALLPALAGNVEALEERLEALEQNKYDWNEATKWLDEREAAQARAESLAHLLQEARDQLQVPEDPHAVPDAGTPCPTCELMVRIDAALAPPPNETPDCSHGNPVTEPCIKCATHDTVGRQGEVEKVEL